MRSARRVAGLVVAAAIFSLVTGSTMQPHQASTPSGLGRSSANRIAQIYRQASRAVVEIQITTRLGNTGVTMLSRQGSGFLVDASGDIITCNHVVVGAANVQVTFGNGRTVQVCAVSSDAVDDLALVNVDASAITGMTPLSFANSNSLRLGETAIAIGSPGGLMNSATTGMISGLNRAAGSQTGMIQSDVNIQPGSSGGPLLDLSGQVIGVNAAVARQGTALAFAVPSNVVSAAVSSLKAGRQQ